MARVSPPSFRRSTAQNNTFRQANTLRHALCCLAAATVTAAGSAGSVGIQPTSPPYVTDATLTAVQLSSQAGALRFGGRTFSGGTFIRIALILSDLYLFDSSDLLWHPVSPAGSVPPARYQHCAAVVNGSLLVTFGSNSNGLGGGQDLNSIVWSLSLDTLSWSALPVQAAPAPTPMPRSAASCAVRGDELYVYGGLASSVYPPEPLSDMWAYSTSLQAWRAVAPAPPPPGFDASFLPPGLFGANLVYAPDSDSLLLYGGRSGQSVNYVPNALVNSATYLWGFSAPAAACSAGGCTVNITGWWVALPVQTDSPARAFGSAVFDPAFSRMCVANGDAFIDSSGDHPVQDVLCMDTRGLPAALRALRLGMSSSRLLQAQPYPGVSPAATVTPSSSLAPPLVSASVTWSLLQLQPGNVPARVYGAAALLGGGPVQCGHAIAPSPSAPATNGSSASAPSTPSGSSAPLGSLCSTLLISGGTDGSYVPASYSADTLLLQLPTLSNAGIWALYVDPSALTGSFVLFSYLTYSIALLILVSLFFLTLIRRLVLRHMQNREVAAIMQAAAANNAASRMRMRQLRMQLGIPVGTGVGDDDGEPIGVSPACIASLPTYVFKAEDADLCSTPSPAAATTQPGQVAGPAMNGLAAGGGLTPSATWERFGSSRSSSEAMEGGDAGASSARRTASSATVASQSGVGNGGGSAPASAGAVSGGGGGGALSSLRRLAYARSTSFHRGSRRLDAPGGMLASSAAAPAAAGAAAHDAAGWSDSGYHHPETQKCCSVCLADYVEGDELRILPCMHRYHSECIGRWLLHHRLCPLCKADVMAAAI